MTSSSTCAFVAMLVVLMSAEGVGAQGSKHTGAPECRTGAACVAPRQPLSSVVPLATQRDGDYCRRDECRDANIDESGRLLPYVYYHAMTVVKWRNHFVQSQ